MVSPIELISQLSNRIDLLEEKVIDLEKKLKQTEAKENNELPKYQKKYLNFLKHRND